MPGLFQTLAAQWDLWTGRYQAFFATADEDVQGCVDVLEEVRRHELNRVAGASVLDSHAFSGEELPYRLVACRDTRSGRIIGCIRLTNALASKAIPSSREEYHLDLFEDGMLDRLTILTRLAVLKPYRRSPAAVVIVGFSFASLMEEGGQGILMSCEPNLFSLYRRLGCRPIGPVHNSPSGGYRVPMIGIPDRDYLTACGSPVVSLLKHLDFEQFEPMRAWYHNLIRENGEIQVGVSFYDADDDEGDEHDALTRGLSEKGRAAFLKNAMTIRCSDGDVLIAENDGGKSFGVVRRGMVRAVKDGRTVAMLGEGDIFGEIANILGINRSAQVVAAGDDTEVLLFSVSAIRRLTDAADRAVIWENLARILARKVLMTTELLG